MARKEGLLNSIVSFGNGKSRPKIEGMHPVYGGNGVLGYAAESNYDGETIIIGRVGAYCGATYYESRPIWVSDNALAAKPKKGNDAKYLYYLLKNLDLNQHAEGSSHPLVTQTLLNSIDIVYSDNEDEQKAIASVLSSLDEKIDLLHRQNKTLEAIAETLFRQRFVEGAQEGWEVVSLEDVTTRITDGAHQSPPTVDIGLPMASVKDMYQWGINTDTCRHISPNDFNALVKADCRPLKNDILIAKDGSYLKHVFIAEKDIDVVILSSIAILRPNGKYHPLLLTTFLKLESTRVGLENIVTGAVIPRIVLKDFRRYRLVLPPKAIQEKALIGIQPLYEKCWENNRQIHTLEKLRNTLLPKLMSGEVRVQYEADQNNVVSIMDELRRRAQESCENKGYVDMSRIANEMGIAIVKDLSVNKAQIKREGDVYTIHVKEPGDNFSIAHEMVHYAEDQEHIKKYAVGRKDEYSLNKAHEKKTDALAAEIIMPEEYVRDYIARSVGQNPNHLENKLIRKCAKQFRVSEIAMRYRLENLGYRLQQR